jgi:alpha,alpha-trehalose phosphorylase
MAAEIGYERLAEEYFRYALLMDLADVNGNVVDGVHIASTGGVWMALTYGFGGMRDHDGVLRFDPRLPSSWRRLTFPLRFRDRSLRVTFERDRLTVLLEAGEPMTIELRGESLHLLEGEPVERPVPARWLDPSELPPRTPIPMKERHA